MTEDIMNKMYTSLIDTDLKYGYKTLKDLQLAVDNCDIDSLVIWLKDAHSKVVDSEEVLLHIKDEKKEKEYTKLIDTFKKDMDLTLDKLKYCKCERTKDND